MAVREEELAADREDTTRSDARLEVLARVDSFRIGVPRGMAAEVERSQLVDRLLASTTTKLAVVSAPAGYGKSTLLRQWAVKEPRHVAWVTSSATDADSAVFLSALAAAMEAVEPLPESLFESLRRRDAALGPGIAGLSEAVAGCTRPFVLVLDDCHRLSERQMAEIDQLSAAVPTGSCLVLSSRSQPPLTLGRLRVQMDLLELDHRDLALDPAEMVAILDHSGVDVPEGVVQELFQQTDGWVAGLQLAVIGWRARATTSLEEPAAPFGRLQPGDRYLSQYLNEEVLAYLTPERRSFLEAASVLGHPSGDALDFLLDRTESAAELEDVAKAKAYFVTPLDNSATTYKLHDLFGELLQEELRRNDPARFCALHTRASTWYEARDHLDEAIRHAIASLDRERAGRLICQFAVMYAGLGRNDTLGLWLEWYDESDQSDVPDVAFARLIHLLITADIERLELELARARHLEDHGRLADGTPSLAVGIAVVEAAAGRLPVQELQRQTGIVMDAGREGNPWWSLAAGLQGAAELLMGNIAEAKSLLEAAEEGIRGMAMFYGPVLANLALVDLEMDDLRRASGHIDLAIDVVRDGDVGALPAVMLVWAVAARVEAQRGRRSAAVECAARALAGVEQVGGSRMFATRLQLVVPVCLGQAYLELGEVDQAEDLYRRADALRATEPRAALAHDHLDALLRAIEHSRTSRPSVDLTAAEQRVLQLLPTHLSIQEIADRLFVSRNTAKTQALAVYRKLEVTSRSAAVERARAARLITD